VPLINPLTQEHVDAINRVLRSLADIDDTIKACEECGLDMSQRKDLQNAHRDFATKVKQIFMREHP